jgi:uncharacterized membrane protein YkvI
MAYRVKAVIIVIAIINIAGNSSRMNKKTKLPIFGAIVAVALPL